MHRVASLLADRLRAELPAPAVVAVALHGLAAGAVVAAGENGAVSAVVALPPDVAAKEFNINHT